MLEKLHLLLSETAQIVSVWVDDSGKYWAQTAPLENREVTADEILTATKASKIDTINAECRERLIARS